MTRHIRHLVSGHLLRAAARIAIIMSLFVGLGTTVLSQTGARPDRGIRPVGSYSVSDIENISLTNGNVNLSIPLAALPPVAGGKLSWVVRAVYNSKSWNVTQQEFPENPPVPGYATNFIQLSDVAGWSVGGAYRIDVQTPEQDYNGVIPDYPDPEFTLLSQYRWKMILTTPDGAKHELRPTDYLSYTGNRDWARGYYKDTPRADSVDATLRYYSLDGSYLWAKIQPFPIGGSPTKWDVFMPDGTRIKHRNGVQQIIDTNGNSISIYTSEDNVTHYVDNLTGREIKFGYNPSTNTTQVQYQTVGGGWVGIDVNFGTTHVQGMTYERGDPCLTEGLVDTEIVVVRSIVLPQTEPGVTRQFIFSYNSDTTDTVSMSRRLDCQPNYQPITSASHGWGSLSQMVMPLGATVNYSYDLDAVHEPFFDPARVARETITQKTMNHDQITDPWSYSIGLVSGSVTAPDGSVTTETFYTHDPGLIGTFGGPTGQAGLVYRTNRSGKVIVERHWSLKQFSGGNGAFPGGQTGFNPVVDAEYTTLLDNSSPPQPLKMSAKTFQYDYNGSLTSESDYDWFSPSLVSRDAQGVPTGVPVSATLLRTVTTSYYNPATTLSSGNVYAKRDLTTVTPFILNAPKLTTVGPSQSEFHYDGIDNTPPSKGNLTKERHWEGTKWIQTTHAYDAVTGNLTSTTDPKLNVTQFFYDATQALPSSVVVDPNNQATGDELTTSTTYDFATGLPTSVTDPNGRITSSVYTNQLLESVDPFNRPGVVTDAQGRGTVSRYFDNARQGEVWSDLNNPFDALLKSRTSSDQLGRVVKTESSEDGASYTIFADSVYQQMGRITIATNPMRAQAASTDGWSRTTRDEIGRVVTVETFSGRYPAGTSTGVMSTSYNANETTVTDQAGKVRRSIVDGAGRLVRVDEPDSTGNLGTVTAPVQPTNYTYDSRGNLTQVVQGSQSRSFVYDGLSRLKQATNPESGTINYTYDDNGNLQTKTDARSVVTTFAYDGLNRVTTRTYSGPAPGGTTPGVTYVYDTLGAGQNGKGRLTSVSSSVSSYSYGSYDVMGRVLTGTQTTDGQNYSMSYQYNLAGGMTSETYPSNKVVVTEYDSAGRIAGVKKDATIYYAGGTSSTSNAMSYTAHGAPATMKLGNGKWEHTNYNSRLQPEQIGLGTSSTDSGTLRLDYTYGTTANNGNVQTQRIVITGSLDVTQNYTYDELNRLKTASESSGANWSQTYGYDRFGNRWVSASTGYALSTLTPQVQSAFTAANNRLVASVYDTAGNQTMDGQSRSFEYDGENRQTKFNSTVGQYFYDGDGRRVKKIDGSGTTVFVYNVGGQLIAEYHNDPVPAPPGGGGTSYLTSDHLGSTRVVTKSDGSVKARYDYLPFGEELGATIGGRTVGTGYGAADGTKQKFTQKERDSESGLDYFLARYYSSAQGRFTSVDPLMASASVTAPQSWNRYAYAFNNPLRFIDPDGQEVKVLDEKALEYIRSTLPKAVRDRVKLDKNGMIDRKALNGIKSKDKNVLDLKALANSSSVIEAATGKGVSGQPEFSYTSVEQVRKEVIDALVKRGEDPKDAAEVAKEVSLPTEFLGRTQTANESGSGNPRVVVSDGTGAAATAPMQELVVTMAHELYGHGLPLTKGKPWGHDNGGPVDVNIRRIEQQTKRNFPGPQATPQSPRPKKP